MGTDHHSRNPRALSTAMAGTGPQTGEARHAGGVDGPWKGSGDVLSSLSGTACVGSGLLVSLEAGAGDDSAAPLPRGVGGGCAQGRPMRGPSVPRIGEGGPRLSVGLLPLNSPTSPCNCTSLLYQHSSLLADL